MKLFSDGFDKVPIKIAALFGIVVAAVLAQASPAKAQAVLYLYTGVTDNGGAANTGVATSVHCTNFSGATQNITVVATAANGTPLVLAGGPGTSVTASVTGGSTITFSTHPTVIFQDAGATSNLATGFVGQGALGILATSVNIVCSAMIVDAAAPNAAGNPAVVGIQLHGLRFNPIAGTQE